MVGKNRPRGNQKKRQEKYVEPGKRVMDVAYLRDGEAVYTGEALVLACLLHAKGKTARAEKELKQVAQMLDDPNLSNR